MRCWQKFFIGLVGVVLILTSCKKEDQIMGRAESEMISIRESMMEQMRTTRFSDDPDNDFSTIISIQHAALIQMAKKELEAGKNVRIRKIAEKIISEKAIEIDKLRQLLNLHPSHIKVPEFNEKILDIFDRADKNGDLQAMSGNIDIDFALLLSQGF